MNKQQIVDTFDALVRKYGFDESPVLGIDDNEDEIELVGRKLYFAQDEKIKRSAQKAFKTKDGELTEYGEVVVNCAKLMDLSLEYFESEEMILDWHEPGCDWALRTVCLAYEVYWHFNGDFLIRSTMNDALESNSLSSPFFRNARTFSHAKADPVYHQLVASVVSEVVNLYIDYDGFLPKKHKPALKPWLLATETPTHGWKLPSIKNTLTLDNMGERQLIHGGSFSIELCYNGASLSLGEKVEIVGGTIKVIDEGNLIHSGDHSFAIDLDRINGYTAEVNYWHQGKFRLLPAILKQQQKMTPSIAKRLEQIEELMLEACNNLLKVAMSTHSEYCLEIHEHLYSQELFSEGFKGFNGQLFRQLQHKYMSSNFCKKAVFNDYQCINFLPAHERQNLDIGLAALKGGRSEYISEVWGRIFCHTQIQLADLAKAYIKEVGSNCYASLPLRLRTEEIRRYTVKTHPNCLNYETDSSVFANREEFMDFLELERTGLANTVINNMLLTGFSPRQAYESTLESISLAVESEELPFLDSAFSG